jgi:hypothetical protein
LWEQERAMADFAYRQPAPVASERWFGSHRCALRSRSGLQQRSARQLTPIPSPAYNNTLHSAGFETGDNQYLSQR